MAQEDFWESNLAIIKRKNKSLYRALDGFFEESDRIFYLDWTREGDAVLAVEDKEKKIRLCSARNPVREGELFAKANITDNYESYVVFGMALGYHIEAFVQKTNSERIVVLENDIEQLAICIRYRNLQELLSNSRVTIVYCKNPEDYIAWLDSEQENIKYCMWEPSIKTIQNEALRTILENYKVLFDSMENLGEVLIHNFHQNQKLGDECVDVLKDKLQGKTMLLLAGGPSLDKHLECIKKTAGREDVVILCVGKVAKRVLQAGIRPDYLVMIDGKAGTRWQIRGIEDCGIPLIYLSTVAAVVASEYQGKRYVAYQDGIEEAQQYAKEKGYTVYDSGGSVATFAIDMGIRMQCSRIICAGLDMGYTGLVTHAGNVGKQIVNEKSLREVEGVHGTTVRTSKTLDIYRRWIERRIENVTGTAFINASDGARIHGMKEKALEEIF